MAKKFTASYQNLKPDPVYNNKLASKFINCMMWKGKKKRGSAGFLRRHGHRKEESQGR